MMSSAYAEMASTSVSAKLKKTRLHVRKLVKGMPPKEKWCSIRAAGRVL
jgi:hypothetical protein